MSLDPCCVGLGSIRSFFSEDLVGEDRQVVYVSLLRYFLAPELFGGRVVGLTEDLSRLRELGRFRGPGLENAGEAEVGEESRAAVLFDEDVVRLHVPMDDPLAVGCG